MSRKRLRLFHGTWAIFSPYDDLYRLGFDPINLMLSEGIPAAIPNADYPGPCLTDSETAARAWATAKADRSFHRLQECTRRPIDRSEVVGVVASVIVDPDYLFVDPNYRYWFWNPHTVVQHKSTTPRNIRDWKTSLKYWHTVSYAKDIPPEDIRILHFVRAEDSKQFLHELDLEDT